MSHRFISASWAFDDSYFSALDTCQGREDTTCLIASSPPIGHLMIQIERSSFGVRGRNHHGRLGVSPSSAVGDAPSGEWKTPSSVSCFAPAGQHPSSFRLRQIGTAPFHKAVACNGY